MDVSKLDNQADVEAYVRLFWLTFKGHYIQNVWDKFVWKPAHMPTLLATRVQLRKGQMDGPTYLEFMKWKTYKGPKDGRGAGQSLDDLKFKVTAQQIRKLIISHRHKQGDVDMLKIFKPISEAVHGSPMPKKSRPSYE